MSAAAFQAFERRHQRLAILQLLAEDAAYAHNDAVLQAGLAALGHTVSGDALRTQLAWLAEQGLVTVREVGELQVARLTRRGADAAAGRAEVPGVARPGPDG